MHPQRQFKIARHAAKAVFRNRSCLAQIIRHNIFMNPLGTNMSVSLSLLEGRPSSSISGLEITFPAQLEQEPARQEWLMAPWSVWSMEPEIAFQAQLEEDSPPGLIGRCGPGGRDNMPSATRPGARTARKWSNDCLAGGAPNRLR